MITTDNFITAHFIDNERKNIEVLLKSDDGTAVNPHILEENTYTKKQEERKVFVSQVKRIAQKEGLIKHIIEEVNPKFIELMMEFLLSNKKEHIDRLFNFKIYLFEQDIVKNCKDSSKKTAIRKAKAPLEALKIFIELWEDSNKI